MGRRKKIALIIVGASGHGRETAWLARESGAEVAGWLDDDDALRGQTVCDLPVLGKVSDWSRYRDASFVVAIGSPRVRREIVRRMEADGRPSFATLVHPHVRRSAYVQIGAGTMISAGCVLTTQVVIGRHNILNVGVTVAHDCVFGDFCTVAPLVPVAGNVRLDDGVEIGTGAAIRQGIRMGYGSMAGMGAVVVKDVPAHQVVVGSPARQFKDLPPWM